MEQSKKNKNNKKKKIIIRTTLNFSFRILTILIAVLLIVSVFFCVKANDFNNVFNNTNVENVSTNKDNSKHSTKSTVENKTEIKTKNNTKNDELKTVYSRQGYTYSMEKVEFYSKDGYIHKIIQKVTYNVDEYKKDKNLSKKASIDTVLKKIKKDGYKLKNRPGYNVQYKRAKDKKTISKTTTIDFDQANIKELKEHGIINISTKVKNIKGHSYINLKDTLKFYGDMGYEEDK